MPSLDGRVLAMCCDSKAVPLLDYHNDEIVLQLEGHTDYNFAVAHNPGRPHELATGSQDTTALVWDIRAPSRPMAQLFALLDGIYTLHYTRDGRYLLVGEGTDSLHVFDT